VNAWVIEPGHGSVWLMDAEYDGEYVHGWVWDDSDAGSGYMPDGYMGQRVTMTYPRSLILRVEDDR